MQTRITILGAGNIGMAIAEGIHNSEITNQPVALTRKNAHFLQEEKKFAFPPNNKLATAMSDVLIIAVQPTQVDELLLEIKEDLNPEHILISVVSGVTIKRIEEIVGNVPVARAMPNTAIRVGESMTCLAFNEKGQKHRALVEGIFNSVGLTLPIPETMFAEATVLCGSGTALALKFIRAFMQAGIQHGFNEEDALTIASQIVKGASIISQGDNHHPESQIDKVTTPGGCTIAALTEMEHAGFSSALLRAIEAGIEKARKLYS